MRLKLKITLNVSTVKRSIPGKIISLDILNLHTKTNFWIIVLFSPPSYQGSFFCENICMLNLFDHFYYKSMHGCFGGTVAAHMFKCMQSKVYFVTVETEVHSDSNYIVSNF